MAGRQPRLVSPPEAEEVDDIRRLPDPMIYSRLPDAIIHRIFSFLPFKDLVKTSVLSKQWRFAWTSTPHIDLSIHSEDDIPWISRSLSHCTAARLKKFHLVATISYLIVPEKLDRLFCFAVARRVEDVSLVFAYPYPDLPLLIFADPEVRVPKVLYDCESLVSLRVSDFRFSKKAIINWPSLKKLHIRHVRLDNKRIMNILSGCPALESLRLLCCPIIDWDLRFDSATMRELVIHVGSISSFHIWAPNLLSLNVWGRYVPNGEISLTGADLSFDYVPNEENSLAGVDLSVDEPSAVSGSFRERLKLLLVRFLSNLVGWWWRLVYHAVSIWPLHIWARNIISMNVWSIFGIGLNEEISQTGADLNFDEPSAVPGSVRESLNSLPVRILSNLVGWKLIHHENHRGSSHYGQIPPALMWEDHSY